MKKENKPNSELIKAWFYTQSIKSIEDAPLHYFQTLLDLNLIDLELTEEQLKMPAIDAALAKYNYVAESLQDRMRPLIDKPVINSFEQAHYERLYKDLETTKFFRNDFAIFRTKNKMSERISVVYSDYLLKAAIFYSKPISTISDLDSIGGVVGS